MESCLLKKLTVEQIKCLYLKPILLNTDKFMLPFAKHLVNIDLKIIRIGQVNILTVPEEFTSISWQKIEEGGGSYIRIIRR